MPTDPWVREPLTENELTDARDKASALTGDLSPLEEQWLRYLATIDQLEADLKSAKENARDLHNAIDTAMSHLKAVTGSGLERQMLARAKVALRDGMVAEHDRNWSKEKS